MSYQPRIRVRGKLRLESSIDACDFKPWFPGFRIKACPVLDTGYGMTRNFKGL
ncbi:MAG: hypothetical protein Q8O43_07335 [Dehalococcoidia bacterium]|nr:hypothetical protein [Dehalococcoidia bacterium]